MMILVRGVGLGTFILKPFLLVVLHSMANCVTVCPMLMSFYNFASYDDEITREVCLRHSTKSGWTSIVLSLVSVTY